MTERKLPAEGRDDQIRRTARLLDMIIEIAQRPHYWTLERLVERHELTVRSITRDLGLIRHRLPLRHGADGYFFARLPQLPATTYTFPEALALLSAARAGQAMPGINSAELAAAIARLEVLFPAEIVPLVRDATEKLPRRAAGSHRQGLLAVLHRALAERKQVQICYATGSRAGEATDRIVEPYHILAYGRSWQLIAYDHKREAIREFKLDRIREAALLDLGYTIPENFDVDAYLGDGWGLMRGAAGAAETVVLLFEPEAGRWVAEESWHASQDSETLADGRVRVTFRVGITPEMISWLLYYGARVRILEPAWLAERVREEHARAAAAGGGNLG